MIPGPHSILIKRCVVKAFGCGQNVGFRGRVDPIFPNCCLPDLVDVSISGGGEYFLPAILIYPDSKSVNKTSFSWVPRVFQSWLQPLFGATCHFSQSALSSPTPKISHAAVGIFPDDVRFDADAR